MGTIIGEEGRGGEGRGGTTIGIHSRIRRSLNPRCASRESAVGSQNLEPLRFGFRASGVYL